MDDLIEFDSFLLIQKASGSSSEESNVKKRDKRENGDQIDRIMEQLGQDMAKAMVDLNEVGKSFIGTVRFRLKRVAEERNEMETKVDLTEYKLDEAEKKVFCI